MKKRFDMVDLDCANCAAKMEEAINKIEGVESAAVSFMAQKLSIEAAEEDFDKIMKQVVKAVKKVDADCEVVL
ncbi:MAG: cation transporter [Lachnospiraceae bacterium]|nr:cation transporter [Lachnospiraceae bacterium]